MDRKAALATAAGLVLVVAGAASALGAAWSQSSPSATAPAVSPTIVTEYVDQAGNPVAPPTGAEAGSVVVTLSPQPEQVLVYQEGLPMATAAPAPVIVSAATSFEAEHESEHEVEHESEHESEHEVEGH